MTVELIVLGAAYIGFAIGLSWMAVLLKREIVEAWSETLNGMARSVR